VGYTDLWRCRRCGAMPEILMLGKNFFVKCQNCGDEKVNVHADNIDEAVALWNRRNDPNRRGLLGHVRAWFRRS
jgi:hypothetical protein